jgi:hypothetical protein
MNQFRPVGLLVPALLVLAAALPSFGADQPPAPVVVTNFPPTQQVAGTVTVGQPIPSTRFASTGALVPPVLLSDLDSLADGGVLDASGFASATFSLAITVQGSLGSPGKLGALLVPDVAEILATMRNSGVVQFPITIEASVVPSASGIHQSEPVTIRLAFPRYRVFFYNTSPRSAHAMLYWYLGTS